MEAGWRTHEVATPRIASEAEGETRVAETEAEMGLVSEAETEAEMATESSDPSLRFDPSDLYSLDGSGNNLANPLLGAVGTPRIRSYPPLSGYADGVSEPRKDLPGPERIRDELFRVAPPRKNKDVSQLLLVFGQWVAHDITRSADSKEEMNVPCSFAAGAGTAANAVAALAVPLPSQCRADACPAAAAAAEGGTGSPPHHLPFHRTARTNSTGGISNVVSKDFIERIEGNATPHSPVNFATTFLDLDAMYGGPLQSELRSGVGGRFIMDELTDLPPKDEAGMFVMGDPTSRFTPGFFALSVIWKIYHNKKADALQQKDPTMNDEDLFQAARMETIAAYQHIVEETYVPTILGEALDPYSGYDDKVDPSIDVFFSTCSFRYGHSGVSGAVRLLDKTFSPLPRDPILLRDAFNQTETVIAMLGDRLEPIVRGMAYEPSKSIDASFVDDVSLFTGTMTIKNVQRGRDNGLPSYNEAREGLNLTRVQSFEDLAQGDETIAKALRGLYGDSGLDNVDAYVGALLEVPATPTMVMGPLMTASIKEQFTRLRDGDRLWYKNRYSQEEYEAFPSLSEIIKEVFDEEEMRLFPKDSFAIFGPSSQALNLDSGGSLSLLSGAYNMSWKIHKKGKRRWVDMSLRVTDLIDEGYIGVGWGSQVMNGANIWLCDGRRDAELSPSCPAVSVPSGNIGERQATSANQNPPSFSCCVSQGKQHVRSECTREGNTGYYPLEVIDSCLSPESSSVTVRVPLCPQVAAITGDDMSNDCFRMPDGELEFIAAYGPSGFDRAHGFSRRTSGQVNLIAGAGTVSNSDDSAQAGLFAVHGAVMLICWLVLVPAAIFIMRYMKAKSWRRAAHFTLVGFAGSLMLSLAFAAVVSVEGTSFGTREGGAPAGKHKATGLSLCLLVGCQMVSGEIRRTRAIGKKVKHRMIERAVFRFHQLTGFALMGLAWWNCYMGLVQIGPYEGDVVELTLASTHTVPLGYDMEFFGMFRKYIFFPYIATVCLIFLIADFREWRSRGSKHLEMVERVRQGKERIWDGDVVDDATMDSMSVDMFLDLTRNGGAFCIVDGYVIDIGAFMEHHPGGPAVLRFAIGSDITDHLLGASDVDGKRHLHSPTALRMLRPMIKAKLDMPDGGGDNLRGSGLGSSRHHDTRQRIQQGLKRRLFRNATVLSNEYVSATRESNEKPIIRICLAMPRENDMDLAVGQLPPSTTFLFRAKGNAGQTIERHYTPVQCNLRDHSAHDGAHNKFVEYLRNLSQHWRKEEVVYEFFFSVVPSGQMSSVLLRKKPGSHLMVQGPLVNETVLDKLNSQQKWTDVILIAQGTGISPMLQLVDHFLGTPKVRGGNLKIFLAWFVKDRSQSLEDAARLRERAEGVKSFRYFIIDRKDELSSSTLSQRDISLRTQVQMPPAAAWSSVQSALRKGHVSGKAFISLDTTRFPDPRTTRHDAAAEDSFHDDKSGDFAIDDNPEAATLAAVGASASLSSPLSVSGFFKSKLPSSPQVKKAEETSGSVLKPGVSNAKPYAVPLTPSVSQGAENLSRMPQVAISGSSVSSGDNLAALDLAITGPKSHNINGSLRRLSISSSEEEVAGHDDIRTGYEEQEEQQARDDFLDRYRMKTRLDRELMWRLLSLATGNKLLDHNQNNSSADLEDNWADNAISWDKEVDNEQLIGSNTIVSVCGCPDFEDDCTMMLRGLGLEYNQLIKFGKDCVPLDHDHLVTYEESLRRHLFMKREARLTNFLRTFTRKKLSHSIS